MSDLSQRLRNFAVWNNRHSHYDPVPVCQEAAAEIDRLQSQLVNIRTTMRDHWLTSIVCNHEAKTDKACCWCGWASDERPTVGDAIDAWINHVFPLTDETREDT